MKFAYSRGWGQYDNTPENRTADDFKSFRDALLDDRSQVKGQAWIAAEFCEAPDDDLHKERFRGAIGSPHRCAACAQPRAWLGLDVDGGMTEESFVALQRILQTYQAFIYTTASHTREKPRARVIVALDKPAARAELIEASRAFRARVTRDLQAQGSPAPALDEACDRPEQPIYLPLVDAQTFVMDGEPAALSELLAESLSESRESLSRVTESRISDESGVIVARDRHADLLALSADVARLAHKHRIGEEAALQLLQTEAERGRWTRDMPDAELREAFDGARAKIQSGTWETEPDFEPVPLGDLTDVLAPPVQFVMHPYLPRRHVTLLGGHGGTGKTYLALTLAAHVATGRDWAGHHAASPCRVLFVSLEDETDLILWRLSHVCREYGLEDVQDNFELWDGTKGFVTLFKENAIGLDPTAAWETLTRHTKGFDLVVIDNASDAFCANANDGQRVREFLRRLQNLARENNAAFLLLAHIDKQAARHGANGQSYLGSTAWHNTVRSRLALTQDGRCLTLHHEKHNHTSRADDVTLQRTPDGVPVPVRETSIDPATLRDDDDAIFEVMRRAHAHNETIYPKRGDKYNAQRALEPWGLPKKFLGKAGQNLFYASIERLERAGRIVLGEHENDNRKKRQSWIPVS